MNVIKTLIVLFVFSSSALSQASSKVQLKKIDSNSTPLYIYNGKLLQDLSGSAYINGNVYLASDGGKNSTFPELRVANLDKLQLPAPIFQRQIVQRDIEGATQIGNSLYITSSMSQVSEDTADYRVLSHIRVSDSGDVISEQYIYARDMIVTALEKHFGDLDWLRRVKVSFGKSGGVNVEGLSASHNGSDNLIIGFRSPLWDEKFGSPQLDDSLSLKVGNAIIMELASPFDSSNPKASVKLLDLNGQGIRGMEYIPALKGYVVISGGVEKLNEYHLWFYDPSTNTTEKLSKKDDDFMSLCRPESILNIPEKKQLIVFSEESGKACDNMSHSFIQYQY